MTVLLALFTVTGLNKIMALSGYEVHAISAKEATDVIVRNHYLHRRGPASWAFGLFDDVGSLVGVITYGTPASPSLVKGIAGEGEADHVTELTRLWIADITPKNAESFLIGNSLKMLPEDKDIVVSFAEIRAGHVGTVYQATNWLYTGLSDRHVEWQVDGVESSKHGRHLFDEFGGVDGAKEALGNRLVRTERPRKHRYIFLRGSKWRKKELLLKLRYRPEPYPSNTGQDVVA
jgi:hypothetical protein